MKIKNKIISILIIIITIINILSISNANFIGEEFEISTILTDIPYSYNNEEKQAIIRLTNTNFPVYTTKKNLESNTFTTNNFKFYANNEIKNILKNGYGCKNVEEFEGLTWEEAYLATQEAIYITVEERNIDNYVLDQDIANNTKANRILNATRKILENASKEESDALDVIRNDTTWKKYEPDNNYKYKEYTIKSGNTQPGIVVISKGEDIKIIDKKTNEIKRKFMNGDKFYLVVPKDVNQEIEIDFSYEVSSLYLYDYKKTNDLQEQYLLAEPVGLSCGTVFEENVTTLIKVEILNEDQETKIPIKGNIFSVINEDNSVVQANLKTNEEGKINITLPKGKYYLKQISAITGYNLNKSLIEININDEEKISLKIASTKPGTQQITTTNKEINVIEENKNVVENNITEVSNITITNINKEIINETNETNLHNINNFINTINRKNKIDLIKENTYKNFIQENIVRPSETLEGENVTIQLTKQEYLSYIDRIMLDSAKVPILPVASK